MSWVNFNCILLIIEYDLYSIEWFVNFIFNSDFENSLGNVNVKCVKKFYEVNMLTILVVSKYVLKRKQDV